MNQYQLLKALICMGLLAITSCASTTTKTPELVNTLQPLASESTASPRPNLPQFTFKEGEPFVSLIGIDPFGPIWNSGVYPFVSGESVAEFINRIGGIAPQMYDLDGRPFQQIAGVSIRSGSNKDIFLNFHKAEDRRKLWLHKLNKQDIIMVVEFSLFGGLEGYNGPYREEWLIKIPKPSDL